MDTWRFAFAIELRYLLYPMKESARGGERTIFLEARKRKRKEKNPSMCKEIFQVKSRKYLFFSFRDCKKQMKRKLSLHLHGDPFFVSLCYLLIMETFQRRWS